ncbi:hypothetical protein K0M31_001973 [Melipona bicolor]|uniref:Uncharacterized protein n=1 Tax=Melipona bicolor TaxID=60889 RepID=A0AA40KY42_9HYME|nr:hypothetical protein K0M31_001973 [Melipona bicolor]
MSVVRKETKVPFPFHRFDGKTGLWCVHGLWSGFSEGLLVELASGKKAERECRRYDVEKQEQQDRKRT